MGQSTVMFLAVEKSRFLDVMPFVINALDKYVRRELDKYWKLKGYNNRASFLCSDENQNPKVFSNGVYNVTTYNFNSFNIRFSILEEKRDLFVTHTCSSDYADTYKGEKIIFSLGNWGLSVEIMNQIISACRSFGDCYYIENDCSGNEFLKFSQTAANVEA